MSSLDETWYAVVDDLIGGWAVATRDCPASELVVALGKNGEPAPDREVAHFTLEEDAREIAALHNAAVELAREQAAFFARLRRD